MIPIKVRSRSRRLGPCSRAPPPRLCGPAPARRNLASSSRQARRVLENARVAGPLSLIDEFRSFAQRSRDSQTERIRRRDVDDRVELDNLLHGEITGSSTAKDPVDMHGGSPAQHHPEQCRPERSEAWRETIASVSYGCPHRPRGQFTRVRAERNETKVPLPETRCSSTLLSCARWASLDSLYEFARRVERSRLELPAR